MTTNVPVVPGRPTSRCNFNGFRQYVNGFFELIGFGGGDCVLFHGCTAVSVHLIEHATAYPSLQRTPLPQEQVEYLTQCHTVSHVEGLHHGPSLTGLSTLEPMNDRLRSKM